MRYLKRFLLPFTLLVAVVAAPAQDQVKTLPVRRSIIPAGTTVLKDLAYGPHGRNKLDLYVPKSDTPLPLIVWVHGGGWEMGSKERTGPSLALLEKGFALASINYRLSSQAVFPAQIEDCKAAVRWLRANAKEHNLDPVHFGAWGMSAGGHLVALLGTTGDADFCSLDGGKDCSSAVQAVCDWFGPADFLHWGAITVNDPFARRPSPISRLFGGLVPDKLDVAKKASPILHVSKASAPFLIFHGDKDGMVPLQQSEALNEALKKAGVESALHVVKNAGHGGVGFMVPEVLQEEEAFFGKYLKSKLAAK
ncbi:MAG TPA: alpha/beta hydrolase [Gemmataceae bacterium]|jgi:acetyl esterase/lipase|nr:alpha/beta hydrolase [Gemmataceae bacterium]